MNGDFCPYKENQVLETFLRISSFLKKEASHTG